MVCFSRCAKERLYFALCASSATFGLLRTIFGDVDLPIAQYLRVAMLTSVVAVGAWILRSFSRRCRRTRFRTEPHEKTKKVARAQTDLLRVLQEKEITRVGGNPVIKVDFRCVAATNKNLELLIEEGVSRLDLFYRLNVFHIELPHFANARKTSRFWWNISCGNFPWP